MLLKLACAVYFPPVYVQTLAKPGEINTKSTIDLEILRKF